MRGSSGKSSSGQKGHQGSTLKERHPDHTIEHRPGFCNYCGLYLKLLEFEEKWGKKYPLSCKSWLDNWVNLSAFFEYDHGIREIIYTTNPIEGVHRQIRKITKTKGAFSSEQALMKLMYLVIKNISKKWTMPIHNWGLAFSQLYIKFGDRILHENRGF